MENAAKGMWVEIENEVLSANERAPQVPEDTNKTPLMMWSKGFLIEDSAIVGDVVSVRTLSDRVTTGKLVVINPRFCHDFGNTIPELLGVGVDSKADSRNQGGIK